MKDISERILHPWEYRQKKRRLIKTIIILAIIFSLSFIGYSNREILKNKLNDILPKINATKDKVTEFIVGKPENITEIELKVHQLINEEREKYGLSPLLLDTKLSYIAREHSEDMTTRDYFSHYDLEGHDFTYRYEQSEYSCNILYKIDPDGTQWYAKGAENIAKTPKGNVVGCGSVYNSDEIASCIVSGWMSSPGHRQNILKSYWKAEGIGIAKSNNNEFYTTQNFC